MAELQMRQGTVYESVKSGERRMFIHHNPMQMQSLQLSSTSKEGAFDLANPQVVSIDTLIDMRKNGEWRELGDLPPEVVNAVLRSLISLPTLDAETHSALQMLMRERGIVLSES